MVAMFQGGWEIVVILAAILIVMGSLRRKTRAGRCVAYVGLIFLVLIGLMWVAVRLGWIG